MMQEQLLVASIAGRRLAIPSGQILSVIELEKIERVPRSPPGVAGLTALRSRVLTVIDCAQVIDPANYSDEDGRAGEPYAVVIDIDDYGYALLVEDVEDVTEPHDKLSDAKADLGGGWSNFVIGVAETSVGALVVVDPVRIVRGAIAGATKAA